MRKRKCVAFFAVVACILLSAYLSVIRFSYANISNILEGRVSISMTEASGWEAAGQGRVIFLDPDVLAILCDEPVFVRNVLIMGESGQEMTSIEVFYRSSADVMEEWKRQEIPVEAKNRDIYFEVNDVVCEMHMTLRTGEEGISDVSGVALNPTKLNVNYLLLLLSFLFPFSLIFFFSF